MFLQQRFFIVRSIVVSLCTFIEGVPAGTQARSILCEMFPQEHSTRFAHDLPACTAFLHCIWNV